MSCLAARSWLLLRKMCSLPDPSPSPDQLLFALTRLSQIRDWPEHELPISEKLAFFRETRHSFGRTALLFSGGGSFGTYHMVWKGRVEGWAQKEVPRGIREQKGGSRGETSHSFGRSVLLFSRQSSFGTYHMVWKAGGGEQGHEDVCGAKKSAFTPLCLSLLITHLLHCFLRPGRVQGAV